MAGTAKPDIEGLKQEGKYKVISFSGTGGGAVENFGLFDGTTPNEWDTPRVFYWTDTRNDYLEIEILSPKVNIWRCGFSTTGRSNPLTIKKWDGYSYIDVTTQYPQVLSDIGNPNWEQTISGLPKGVYKFMGGNGLRVDVEWYIEDLLSTKYLLKQNNQYYTFNNSGITLSPSQELTEDNFKNNGFDSPESITEEQWNNAFPDKADVKLLTYTDDLDKTEIKAECEIEPFTPYDKLENEFEICMATDKETTV